MPSRRQTLSILSGTAIMAALPSLGYAHRQKTTLSQVEWNESNKTLYVTHSYHMHDAETALAAAGIIAKPDLTSLRARAKLALYTARHFELSTNDTEIDLDLLGAEHEGRTVYVYQEAYMDNAPTGLTVSASMLRDIIPGQLNNVDVTLTGELTSVQFKDKDGPKKVLA